MVRCCSRIETYNGGLGTPKDQEMQQGCSPAPCRSSWSYLRCYVTSGRTSSMPDQRPALLQFILKEQPQVLLPIQHQSSIEQGQVRELFWSPYLSLHNRVSLTSGWTLGKAIGALQLRCPPRSESQRS
jgi:hypothetical protein